MPRHLSENTMTTTKKKELRGQTIKDHFPPFCVVMEATEKWQIIKGGGGKNHSYQHLKGKPHFY